MLLVALMGALATPAPSASSSAKELPEIGRVRSSFICGVLRERVAPALLRLSASDRSIEAGKNDFLAIAHDQIAHARAAVQLGHVKVENEAGAMVKNLAVVETLLGNPTVFPNNPQTEDARTAADLKARFEAVVAAQQVAINALNGAVETDRLGEMQHEGLNVLYGVVGPERDSFTALANGINADLPVSYLDVAGLATWTDTFVDPRTVGADGVLGNTVYGGLAIALYEQQIAISQLEAELTAAVIPLQRGCSDAEKGTP